MPGGESPDRVVLATVGGGENQQERTSDQKINTRKNPVGAGSTLGALNQGHRPIADRKLYNQAAPMSNISS